MVKQDDPVASVVLPRSMHDCWEYFREPTLIREWHGWEYDGLDAEIRQIFQDQARIGEDHRTINLGTHFFNFFDEEGATRVHVHHSPLPEDSELHDYVPDIDEGWLSFLQQLRFKLTRHADDNRRTLFFSGPPKDPTISPIQLVGLGQVGQQTIGAQYGATVGPGDALTGEVWFVSKNQLGLTVDGWGDGLLVVANGPSGGPPYESGQAILTTYGLTDRDRTDLEHRWQEWWAAHT